MLAKRRLRIPRRRLLLSREKEAPVKLRTGRLLLVRGAGVPVEDHQA